jgi:GntR family transcriptional regulator
MGAVPMARSEGVLKLAAVVPQLEGGQLGHGMGGLTDAPRLLWKQVYDDLASDIRSGVLAVDDRLPSELEMAEQYGVSRDVIRRAKEELAGEGWLIVLHGRGTYVAGTVPSDSD